MNAFNTQDRHAVGINRRPGQSRRLRVSLPALIGRCALAAILGTSGLLHAATEKDSSAFNLKNEMGSVLLPVFSNNKGWVSDGEALIFDNAANGDGAFGWTSRLKHSTGYTIEIRYRITQVNTPGVAGTPKYVFQLQGSDGSGTLALHTVPVGMATADGQLGIYSASGNLALPISAGEWHTLRIADEPNSNDMLAWSDGVQITGVNWQSANNTVNRAWCGDLGISVTDGSYEVDYFRVDTRGAFSPPAPAVPAISQNPQAVTNIIGSRIRLTGQFSGGIANCQWYKDSLPLSEADGPSYTIDPATTADSGWYFLRATNSLGSVDTEPVYVKVLESDTTLPVIQSVDPQVSLEHLRVTFTKPTEPNSQTNAVNYQIQGQPLTILNASRIDQYTVELLTSPQTRGSQFTLKVTGVRDTLNNAIAPNSTVSVTVPMLIPCVQYDAGTGASQPSGPPDPAAAAAGYWMQTTNTNPGMAATAVANDSAGWNAWQISDQNVLSSGGVLDYRMYVDQGSDNFAHTNGWRLTGRCRLTDAVTSTATDHLIVYSDTSLSVRYGMFFGKDTSGNLTVSLLGGATYTLDGDPTAYHLHVLVYNPASEMACYYYDGQLITTNYLGQFLSSVGYNGVSFGSASSTGTGEMNYNLVDFSVLNGTQPVVVSGPQSTTNGVGQKVTFAAKFSPFVGAYQWLSNNIIISGATNASFTTGLITSDYNGAQYVCRALHALGNVETAPATLTVTTDVIPPSIVRVGYSLMYNRVFVTYSEPVLESTATNIANYVWTNAGMSTLSARLIDPFTVELLTSAQTMGTTYALRVSNVKDTSNLAMTANTPASVTAPVLETVARYYAGSTTDTPTTVPDPASAAGGNWSLRFDEDPNLFVGPIKDDLGTGWNAWVVSDSSTVSSHFAQYSLTLPGEVLENASKYGWVISVRGRFVQNFGSSYTLFGQFADAKLNRNLVYFDLNASGDLSAVLQTGGRFVTNALTTSGTGSTDYHMHQIEFTPATTNAAYFLDGTLIATDLNTTRESSSTPGLVWGAGSSVGMGEMNFNLIEFKTVAAPFARIASDTTGVSVQFRGILEACGQLGSAAVWSGVATNISSATNVYTVPIQSQTQQYYRARMP